MDKLEKLLLVNPNVEEVSLNNEAIDDLLPLVPLLAKMQYLKSLKLANNNIQKLPEDLSSLRTLEMLDISHNPIPGLSAVIRGLFSLNALKHLYVDLPYETDEDEIIVSLTSLESFNGTMLAVNADDDLDLDDRLESPARAAAGGAGGAGGAGYSGTPGVTAAPAYRQPAWAPSTSPAAPPSYLATPTAPTPATGGGAGQAPAGAAPQGSHLTSLRSRYTGPAASVSRAEDYQPKTTWDTNDMAQVQRLYLAANSVSGRVASKVEFEDYSKNMIAHLQTLLAGEDDPYRKEAEVLKCKKIMFEYCFEEISRSSYRFDSNLSTVLTTLQETYSNLLGGYDNLTRSVQSHKDRKLEVMRTDMQHAIQEIEQLMQQMDGKDQLPRGGDGDTSQLMNEIGWLRSENEKLQARLRQYEVGRQKMASQLDDGDEWGSKQQKGPSVGRSLSLRQLKEIIEDLYASKSKFDIKCLETHLPRETMEQHLYTYLNQKYGLKNLILDWAQAIINGVRKYSGEDNDVAVFGKILRNEIDEEFRFVQRQLKETVHELLRVYLKGKLPMKGDEEILNLVQKRTAGFVQEEEWVDIVKYMYNAEDSVSIIMRVREVIKEKNPPRRRTGRRDSQSADNNPRESNSILYYDFLKVLLDFQLQGHERFLGKFVRLFRQFDADKNGILNEAEFVQLLRSIDPAKTDQEVNALLDLIDPHDNQLINFSECVTFLSSELVKMMSEMRQQTQTVE